MSVEEFNLIHENLIKKANYYDKQKSVGRIAEKVSIGLGSVAATLLIVVLVFSMNIITTKNEGRNQVSKGNEPEEILKQHEASKVGKKKDDNELLLTVEGATGKPKVIERKFDPTMLDFYTGKSKGLEPYSVEEVKKGVYVHGVNAHSGYALTIYSKVDKNTAQSISLKLENKILKIYVHESVNTEGNNEQNRVLQTLLKEQPTHFEVYRDGVIEQKEKIIYAIE